MRKNFKKKIAIMLAMMVLLFTMKIDVNADYVVNWQDYSYSYIANTNGNIPVSSSFAYLKDAHPFHYYMYYDWDYVKQGTKALQQVQANNGVAPSGEANYIYYIAMLRGVELGLDNRHDHLSPAHGNIFGSTNMHYLENYTSSYAYPSAVSNWVNSDGHLQSLLYCGTSNGCMAFGCSNGGSVTAFSFLNNNGKGILENAKSKNMIKGMTPYTPLVFPNITYPPEYLYKAEYRIQFDETDFTNLNLSGKNVYEGTYYQANCDDISHIINDTKWWYPYLYNSNNFTAVYDYCEISGACGDAVYFSDRMFPSVSYKEHSLDDAVNVSNSHYNGCFVTLALDNFVITSSNPNVVSVDGQSLTLKSSGIVDLTFAYKYNTNYTITRKNIKVTVGGKAPTSATEVTTDKPVKNGDEVSTSEAEYKVEKGKTVTFEEPTDEMKNSSTLTIPDIITINGKDYKVTKIAKKAYANNKCIEYVDGGKYVKSIGEKAFSGCSNLKSIKLKNVTTVGKSAFYKCISLSSFDMPKLTHIEANAFNNCALSSVTLSKVKFIKSGAFAYNKQLTSVTIGKNLLSVGQKAFTKNPKLQKITIKSKHYTPSKKSFSGVKKNVKFIVPSSLVKTYKKNLGITKVTKIQ